MVDAQDRPVRVLIVDDSVVVRRVMARVLQEDARFEITGTVSNAAQALASVIEAPVDLVLLDVEMAGESGLAVLPKLLAEDRKLRVVILSGTCREGSEAALRALSMGASDVVTKPQAGHFSSSFVDNLIERLLDLARSDARKRVASDGPGASALRLRPVGGQIRALAIGGSTGGIGAMTRILADLPPRIGVPIFITQHLPPSFQALFASQLAKVTKLPVVIGSHHLPVKPDVIHVATGQAHLTVERTSGNQTRIVDSAEATGHGAFPSVDPMLRSVGAAYGSGACGIILSGMGRDGLAGADALVDSGGWMIAQDAESSAVWGMPGSVARAGLASAIRAPQDIAAMVIERLFLA